MVEFSPKLVQMPKTSSNNRLAVVLEGLNEVLKNPHPNTPFLDKGTTTSDAIYKLKQIFGPPKKDNNCPRVKEDVPTSRVIRNNQLPRVAQTRQRIETIAKEPIIYPIGTVIWKIIGQVLQRDTVTRYNVDRLYYQNYDNISVKK